MLQSAERAFSNTTGEFSSHRRRSLDVPVDSTPEKLRLKLRAEVEYSLRDVCGNWPTGEFDRIVADVTATSMKYLGAERRGQKKLSLRARAAQIPGAAPVVAAVMGAVHSVQKFLQHETIPLS